MMKNQLAGLMKQAQAMQDNMKKVQEELANTEVEEIVPIGSFDPDAVHLPGIYVHRLVLNAHPEKRIEKRTLRAKTAA